MQNIPQTHFLMLCLLFLNLWKALEQYFCGRILHGPNESGCCSKAGVSIGFGSGARSCVPVRLTGSEMLPWLGNRDFKIHGNHKMFPSVHAFKF